MDKDEFLKLRDRRIVTRESRWAPFVNELAFEMPVQVPLNNKRVSNIRSQVVKRARDTGKFLITTLDLEGNLWCMWTTKPETLTLITP